MGRETIWLASIFPEASGCWLSTTHDFPLSQHHVIFAHFYGIMQKRKVIVMLYSEMNTKSGWWRFYIVNRYEDRDGGDNLSIRVEKENDASAFSDWRLPDVSCTKSFGFSEEDLLEIENFLRDNESIMWDMVNRKEGTDHAAGAA